MKGFLVGRVLVLVLVVWEVAGGEKLQAVGRSV